MTKPWRASGEPWLVTLMLGREPQSSSTSRSPGPDPVDGGALLTDIKANLLRFMVMKETDAVACALWTVHSHAYNLFSHTARLLVTAPEAECAKSGSVSDLAIEPHPEVWKHEGLLRIVSKTETLPCER